MTPTEAVLLLGYVATRREPLRCFVAAYQDIGEGAARLGSDGTLRIEVAWVLGHTTSARRHADELVSLVGAEFIARVLQQHGLGRLLRLSIPDWALLTAIPASGAAQ